MPASSTAVRSWRSLTPRLPIAEILAGVASLVVVASAALPWMSPPPGAEGDTAHVFHGVGFLVLILALFTGASAVVLVYNWLAGSFVRLSGDRGAGSPDDGVLPGGDDRTAPGEAPSTTASRFSATILLVVGAAETAAIVWFSHAYRLDGDVARAPTSGLYLALAGAALTVVAGLVRLAAGRGAR